MKTHTEHRVDGFDEQLVVVSDATKHKGQRHTAFTRFVVHFKSAIGFSGLLFLQLAKLEFERKIL